MKTSEIIVFIVYLLCMLGIGIFFFVKTETAEKRPTSSADVRWDHGLRRCQPEPQT